MLHDWNVTPSAREFSGILSWSREHISATWHALLRDAASGDDVSPYAAPARAEDLSRLPAALVQVGDLEVFRDEDIDYTTRLMQAGVPAELHVYPGAYHAADEGSIFVGRDGDRRDRHAATPIVKRLARRAGIDKPISPHSLITAALDAGVALCDVQEAASHADPRTTMRYDRARRSLHRHAHLHRCHCPLSAGSRAGEPLDF